MTIDQTGKVLLSWIYRVCRFFRTPPTRVQRFASCILIGLFLGSLGCSGGAESSSSQIMGNESAEPQAGLLAGAAKAVITPEELGWLGGYSHRNRPAEGVAKDLFTRVIAFQGADGRRRVLVNADIHIFSRRMHQEIVQEASELYGIQQQDLLLIATHNHSGPALPEGFEPEISWALNEEEMRKIRAAADLVCNRILEAIGEALTDMEPARISFTRGQADFGVNRRVLLPDGNYDFGANPSGVSDPDLPVLVIESHEGKVKALAFTYACHCTSIRNGQEGFYRYHPDFAGVAAEELEQRFSGSTALFVTGCAGDIDPQPQGGVSQAEQNGRSLAAAVIETVDSASRRDLSDQIGTQYEEIQLPLGPIPSREKFLELENSGNAYRQRHARWILAQMDRGGVPDQVPYPIQIWRFGKELALVALAGEVCVDYALRLKRELGTDRVWPVAYANEVPGYIPSERILREGGYEAGWDQEQGPAIPSSAGSTIFYGWAAPFAPGVEDLICETVHRMIQD